MKLKWLFLFFILGFPVSIYLFLQGFGDNQFDVEVFYKTGINQPIGGCQKTTEQFRVPNYNQYDSSFDDSIEGVVVYDLGTPNCDSCQFKINNLMSLSDKFRKWSDLKIFSIVNSAQTGIYPNSSANWKVVTNTQNTLLEFARCGLNIEIPAIKGNRITKNGVVVLVDQQQRIRGYYNVFDRKESDRLGVELEILRIEK